MLNDRKNWKVEQLPKYGWSIIDQKAADDWLPLDDSDRPPGLVAAGGWTREEAQHRIDHPTALFWDRLRDLLEDPTNPRQGEYLDKIFLDHDPLVYEEANADPDNRGAMLERGSALRGRGKEVEAETKWIKPIFADLDAAFPGVKFTICTTRCYFGRPVLQVEWDGNDVDGDEVVEALRKYDDQIELILECSPSAKDLRQIEAALSQAARDGDLPF